MQESAIGHAYNGQLSFSSVIETGVLWYYDFVKMKTDSL